VIADNPFLKCTIGVARVIDKTSYATAFRGIDDLIFLQVHEVEMREPALRILLRPLYELPLRENLAHVLHDELTDFEVFISNQAETLFLGFDKSDLCPFLLLEPSVQAKLAAGAVNTLDE